MIILVAHVEGARPISNKVFFAAFWVILRTRLLTALVLVTCHLVQSTEIGYKITENQNCCGGKSLTQKSENVAGSTKRREAFVFSGEAMHLVT